MTIAIAALACGGSKGEPARPPAVVAPALSSVPAPPVDPPVGDDCRADEKARRATHGPVEAFGPWLLERADETRLWKLGATGVTLTLRVEKGETRMFRDEGLVIDDGSGLVFFELRGGALSIAQGERELVAHDERFLFFADAHAVRRAIWPTNAPAGAVVWTRSDNRSARTVLAGGAVVAVDGALVSFDPPKVLAQGFDFGAATRDGRRIAACDPKTQEVVDLEAQSGKERMRFRVEGEACSSSMLHSDPAHAPDPRFLFWFEYGAQGKVGAAIVVAVGDASTGRVERLVDAELGWSVASTATASVDPASGRLCATFHYSRGSWTQCGWKLTREGHLQRDRPPVERPLPLRGAIEIAREVSPSGRRLAVLTYRKRGETKSDLELVLLRVAPGHAPERERAVVLDAGEFNLDDRAVGSGVVAAPGTTADLPEVHFFDEHTIGVLPGAYGLPLSRVVGADDGKALPLCRDEVSGGAGKPEGCARAGRFVHLGEGVLFDPVTKEKLTMRATEEEWRAALRMPGAACH